MDFAKLSYGQVQAMAEQLKSAAEQMEALRTEINALFAKIGTEEVWNGTAAATTKETFDQLSAKFPEFSQSVTDCYQYLISVVESYKAVDTMVMGK